MTNHVLFEPFLIAGTTLTNRIAMAPMTRSRAGDDGVPTDLHAAYYAQRASAGLIISEATQISDEAQGYLRTPGIYTDAQVNGWKRVTDAVHAKGGRMFLQLWHVGRISHRDNRRSGEHAVAPSAIAAKGSIFTPHGPRDLPVPRALEVAEIERIIGDYARAARRAIEAGFDGVEVHGANGYLIDQFLHASSNQRTDRYGGSIANRCQFLFDVCATVAALIGPERVGVRLSPFGTFNDVSDPAPEDLFAAAIEGLRPLHLGYLHTINPEVSGDRSKAGIAADVAGFARKHWLGAHITAGGYDAATAEAVLQNGKANLVAFGRPYIANPDLVERLRAGQDLAVPDHTTFYSPGPAGYLDYPTLR